MPEKYHQVNGQWPAGIDAIRLTGDEAIAAAKRLYRFAMKRAYKGKWALTSGRRYTWQRSGTFYVNPHRTDALQSDWADLVHLMSHYCHRKLHPNAKPHAPNHHFLEKEMVAYVIAKGWLDGRLRKPVKPVVNVIVKRHENVLQGIARWNTKLKRAQTALRKLNRQKRYYERKQHDVSRTG